MNVSGSAARCAESRTLSAHQSGKTALVLRRVSAVNLELGAGDEGAFKLSFILDLYAEKRVVIPCSIPRRMPYELSFTKRVPLLDREEYINECCVGGDAVVNQLLPAVQRCYTDVQSNQEDWGWFIWFRHGAVRLAMDVFTDDAEEGAFRVHLTSRVKRFLVLDSVVDTPELEDLRALVTTGLSSWVGGPIEVTRLDRNYM